MDLFSSETNNLLPFQGEAFYFGVVMPAVRANRFLELLMNRINWKSDEVMLFGKHITTKRKVAWYGDEPFDYAYSNTKKQAMPWTSDLLDLKTLTETVTGEKFNSCLMNLYHDGNEGVSWHSDAEKDLKKNGAIGSLSFGAERKFMFRHKVNKTQVEVFLEHGSLLIMAGESQTYWQHCLPTTSKIKRPRINLTFRTIVR